MLHQDACEGTLRANFKSRHSPQVSEPLTCGNAGQGLIRSLLCPSRRAVLGQSRGFAKRSLVCGTKDKTQGSHPRAGPRLATTLLANRKRDRDVFLRVCRVVRGDPTASHPQSRGLILKRGCDTRSHKASELAGRRADLGRWCSSGPVLDGPCPL